VTIQTTYRRYVAQLTRGVDFLRSGLGWFYAGTLGAITDSLLEGARQGFIQGLPGHPEQTEDSLNQVGADRELFRYRLDTVATWSARVRNAWQYYEQAGTAIQVLRAVNEWGAITFASTWNPALVGLTEGSWARFQVWIGAGVTPWLPAAKYGSGIVYGGPNVMYGISNALTEDVQTLRKIIRKWKPMRSKASVLIVLSGIACDEPGITCDGGSLVDGFACDSGALCDAPGLVTDGTFSIVRVQV